MKFIGKIFSIIFGAISLVASGITVIYSINDHVNGESSNSSSIQSTIPITESAFPIIQKDNNLEWQRIEDI